MNILEKKRKMLECVTKGSVITHYPFVLDLTQCNSMSHCHTSLCLCSERPAMSVNSTPKHFVLTLFPPTFLQLQTYPKFILLQTLPNILFLFYPPCCCFSSPSIQFKLNTHSHTPNRYTYIHIIVKPNHSSKLSTRHC